MQTRSSGEKKISQRASGVYQESGLEADYQVWKRPKKKVVRGLWMQFKGIRMFLLTV